MRRNYPLVFLLYILLFAALLSMNGEVLVLSIPIALYLLSGLWFAPHDMQLRIERSLSAERVTPNMPVKVTLRVTNFGGLLEELYLEDEIPSA